VQEQIQIQTQVRTGKDAITTGTDTCAAESAITGADAVTATGTSTQ
jgi:hypothetical protein